MSRKFWGALLGGLCVVVAAGYFAIAQDLSTGTLVTSTGSHELAIEVADTPQLRATGLMNRQSMPADQGMLFVFENSRPITMWMKNTYIPLDMLFLDETGTVTHVKTNTTPLSEAVISSNGPARYVLELNGGTARRLNVSKGDRLEHERIPAD